jgi:hypothetical protein
MQPDGTRSSYVAMKARCLTRSDKDFPNYGGRGIKICVRWARSFDAFLADMGPRPSLAHTLDRFPDGDGDYEPGNCRWATPAQQSQNRISTKLCPVSVVLMRYMRRRGALYRQLEHVFDINRSVVRRICIGANWKNALDELVLPLAQPSLHRGMPTRGTG